MIKRDGWGQRYGPARGEILGPWPDPRERKHATTVVPFPWSRLKVAGSNGIKTPELSYRTVLTWGTWKHAGSDALGDVDPRS